MTRLRAILATARVANMPSVVTNVLAGVMIGLFSSRHDQFMKIMLYEIDLPLRSQLLACAFTPALAGLFLYAGGNFLNDWKDAEWDRSHRPERAIPSGLVPRHVYLFSAIALLFTGLRLLVSSGLPSIIAACFIVTCILIYTWLHKTHTGAIIPMALCRCGLVTLGWLAIPGSFNSFWLSVYLIAIFAQILSISLAAKGESAPEDHATHALRMPMMLAVIALLLACGPLLGASLHATSLPLWIRSLPAIATLPAAIWLAGSCRSSSRSPRRFVGLMLAGIPLLDFIVIGPRALILYHYLIHPSPVFEAVATPPDPYLLGLAAAPLLAFALSLALQRLAPAT
jgi:4-hydroxybenzoate polyprenyltransferase